MAKFSARTNGTGLGKRYYEPTRNEKQLEGLQLALRAVWQYTHMRTKISPYKLFRGVQYPDDLDASTNYGKL